MRKLVLSVLFSFLSLALFAQDADEGPILNNMGISYDSIINYLSRTDVSLADKVLMVRTAVQVVDPIDKTMHIFRLTLSQAKKEEQPTEIVRLYCSIANNYYLDTKLEQMKIHLDSAEVYVPKVENDEVLGMYYYMRGVCHVQSGNEEAGQESFYKAIRYYEAAGNNQMVIIYLLYDMAVPYVLRDDPVGMEPIVRKMLSAARQWKSDQGYILAYQMMAYYHNAAFKSTHDSAQQDSSVYYHARTVDVYENADDLLKTMAFTQIYESYANLLRSELEKNDPDWDVVVKNADKTLKHAVPTDTIRILRTHLGKAKALLKKGDLTEGEKEAKIALQMIQTQKAGMHSTYQEDAYEYLSELYAKKNNYKEAHRYEQLKGRAQKEVFKAEQYEKIKELNTKYETEKKELEIEYLTAENEYQTKLRFWHWVAIALVLGAGIFVSQWQATKRKLVANQLKVTQLEKEEVELNLALKEEQAARMEMERYEALLEVHFKELEIEGKESELSALKTEKEELDSHIRAYSERLQTYENEVAKVRNASTEAWAVVCDELSKLIAKRFKGEAAGEYLRTLNRVDSRFLVRLEERLPDVLASTFFKYAVCFVIDMPVRDIAECLSVEPNTVYMVRTRMKKKLDLAAGENMDMLLKSLAMG